MPARSIYLFSLRMRLVGGGVCRVLDGGVASVDLCFVTTSVLAVSCVPCTSIGFGKANILGQP